MDFVEKARIRLERWIEHNDQHEQEYNAFADQLVEAGKSASAQHIREMIEWSAKGTECLRQALKAI